MMSRQIVLDTETTGISQELGHRVIEIGCIELIDRRETGNHYHVYLNPERLVDEGAFAVHGLSNEFLRDKPLFADVAQDFINYVKGSEVVIHNAPFDVGFLNAELQRLSSDCLMLDQLCTIVDTLSMARKKHPGARNSLDALCKRYEVDNSGRELHGALLDASLLAQVYLAMTGGQCFLFASDGNTSQRESLGEQGVVGLPERTWQIPVCAATAEELVCHQEYLSSMSKQLESDCLWSELEEAS